MIIIMTHLYVSVKQTVNKMPQVVTIILQLNDANNVWTNAFVTDSSEDPPMRKWINSLIIINLIY